MKRDFREEYEEFMKKDTPDLWSRIESGIEEKENQSVKQESSISDIRQGGTWRAI